MGREKTVIRIEDRLRIKHVIELLTQALKNFWRLVSRIMPDYEEHVRWLNQNGANLDL
ncbi:MAG: M48 family metallopeptidase [Deltaproteobacteria bacterium]|nr:M48 family metallopeptidase [Deltaproteobacteria bacterium]